MRDPTTFSTTLGSRSTVTAHVVVAHSLKMMSLLVQVETSKGQPQIPSALHPLSQTLECIPWQLQEYLRLPIPGKPGSWTQWTIGWGGRGSGAPFHLHDMATNLAIIGEKRYGVTNRSLLCHQCQLAFIFVVLCSWFLYPPSHSTYSIRPVYEWFRTVLPTLPSHEKPIQFTQQAGDLLLLPGWWAHSTMCVGDCMSVSIVQSNLRATDKNPRGMMHEVVFSCFRLLIGCTNHNQLCCV